MSYFTNISIGVFLNNKYTGKINAPIITIYIPTIINKKYLKPNVNPGKYWLPNNENEYITTKPKTAVHVAITKPSIIYLPIIFDLLEPKALYTPIV